MGLKACGHCQPAVRSTGELHDHSTIQRVLLTDYAWSDLAIERRTHFLSKAHYLRPHRNSFATAAHHYRRTYRQTLGQVDWEEGLEERTVGHMLACLLARVAGRSPLEYLGRAFRRYRRQLVFRSGCRLVRRPIESRFVDSVGAVGEV
jgi:hypothetical protein